MQANSGRHNYSSFDSSPLILETAERKEKITKKRISRERKRELFR